MKSKILTFLIVLTSGVVSASTNSKFHNVELKFGNEVIMNEVGGVIADTPDQLETTVKTYLGWKQQYAREFSHVPFNSPEAQKYRAEFLRFRPDLKLKREIPSNVSNPEALEKIQKSLIKWGWSARDVEEFISLPLSSREARMYRRRFMKEHPTLNRGISSARIQPPVASLKPRAASPELAKRLQNLRDAEARDNERWVRQTS
jgi:hypothetical protein